MARQIVGSSIAAAAAALGLGWLGLVNGPAHAAAPTDPAAATGSFEEFLAAAEAAPKPEALAAPFAEDCARARREMNRARCRGTQSFLRARLPNKTLYAVVDSSRVVSVSAYDAGARGYRVRLLGCVTCDDPVVDAQGESRYVTLAVPAKSAASLREAVVLAETTVAVENPEAGKVFETKVKPHLRAEFLFRGDGTPWTHGGRKGVAFTPVGMRIFNRCTGDVVYSQPRSSKKVAVVEDLPGCAAPAVVASAPSAARNKEAVSISNAPEKLGASEINAAMHETRAAIDACDVQYAKTGAVELEFDLNGTGGPAQAVRAKGALGGTPVATCLLEAVRGVKFPKFSQARQTFTYPVRLGAVKR